MITEKLESQGRHALVKRIDCDFVVVGGGLSGVCAAISAARAGSSVTLIQDRPVLGGNASSEVRLWALGATSHMGNNNRWAREDGVIGEILVENMHRNKEGNPIILDALLLDKVMAEKNICLLLNTTMTAIHKKSGKEIESVTAFNPINDTEYNVHAPLFCDCSGDGVMAHRAGAAYRMGGEDSQEFSEGFSPSDAFGELLGHSMTFYTKRCEQKVDYIAPEFALKDIKLVPKYESIQPDKYGCNYWWFEYGGELDTIHDSEVIRQELSKVVFGAWDYVKNSGKFPEAEKLTLEWVGNIPGKRESRRFIGHYMLTQNDIVNQNRFEDAVAFGGWAIDLHPAKGVYSSLPSCCQYHSKGIYSIPLRCYIPRDIDNLFIAGRIISASHVAFGSTRVMATCGLGGQAVGEAAALCKKYNCAPAALLEARKMVELQQRLNLNGQSIPFTFIDQKSNLLADAEINADSTMVLAQIPQDGTWIDLEYGAAQMLPLKKDTQYTFTLGAKVLQDTELTAELYISSKHGNYTPDKAVESLVLNLEKGETELKLAFKKTLELDQYAFIIFRANPDVMLAASSFRCSGILSVFNKFNLKVGNTGKQCPPQGSGFESFEFWCPERRPAGKNLALGISPALEDFKVGNLINGYTRPTTTSNAWIAGADAQKATLACEFAQQKEVREITIYFDSDFDHPMESVQWGHPENDSPFCVRNVRITDAIGETVASVEGNFKSIARISLKKPVNTDKLIFEFDRVNEYVPISVFGIYAE